MKRIIESIFVAAILFWIDLAKFTFESHLATLAVFLSFQYMQYVENVRDTVKDDSSRLTAIVVVKEIVWITVFYYNKVYPAIFGSIVFLLYPYYRRWIAKRTALDLYGTTSNTHAGTSRNYGNAVNGAR